MYASTEREVMMLSYLVSGGLICHICAAGMVNAGYLEVNGDKADCLSPCSPFWVPRFCVLTHNSRLYYFQSREHVPKHEGVVSLG